MKRSTLAVGFLAVSFLLGAGASLAQPEPERSRTVSLNPVVLDVGRPLPAVPEGRKARAGDPRAAEVVLVKFPGPVTARQLKALRAAGRIYTYLPHDAFSTGLERPSRAG